MTHRFELSRNLVSRPVSFWLASFVLFGCSNDPRDLYVRNPERDAAPDAARAPMPVERTPYESALRVYGDEAACVACVEAECETEARACAGDEDCARQAACRAGCDGPACIFWECKEPYPYDEQPTAMLEQCLLDRCTEACRVGQSFDCAGNYADVAPDETGEVTVTWQLTDYVGEPLGAGWRARGCRFEDPECKDFVSTTTSNDQGIVEVSFPLTRTFSGTYRPLEGYAELIELGRDPDDATTTLVFFGDREHPHVLPRSNKQPIPALGLVEEDWMLLAPLFGREQDPTRGAIGTVVWDCRMSTIAPALGVRIEIDQPDESTWEAYGLSGAEATDTTGLAQLYNVPPGRVTVSARFQGEVVASSTVLVRAGGLTAAWLLPHPR